MIKRLHKALCNKVLGNTATKYFLIDGRKFYKGDIMFKSLSNIFQKDELVSVKVVKRTETRGRKKLSKRAKVINLLASGESVSWKTLRTKFDLVSPRALIDTLRAEGNMIYVNKSAKGTSYRMGQPTKAIVAAGIKALYGTQYAYNNA
jgi:hypothetical protein